MIHMCHVMILSNNLSISLQKEAQPCLSEEHESKSIRMAPKEKKHGKISFTMAWK